MRTIAAGAFLPVAPGRLGGSARATRRSRPPSRCRRPTAGSRSRQAPAVVGGGGDQQCARCVSNDDEADLQARREARSRSRRAAPVAAASRLGATSVGRSWSADVSMASMTVARSQRDPLGSRPAKARESTTSAASIASGRHVSLPAGTTRRNRGQQVDAGEPQQRCGDAAAARGRSRDDGEPGQGSSSHQEQARKVTTCTPGIEAAEPGPRPAGRGPGRRSSGGARPVTNRRMSEHPVAVGGQVQVLGARPADAARRSRRAERSAATAYRSRSDASGSARAVPGRSRCRRG